jgi:hypothetical protein
MVVVDVLVVEFVVYPGLVVVVVIPHQSSN